ncbi:MAG TPA: rhomboid family intramembrane serine protease [Baekduia sp.]|uniref:rhomboid family intramembrane serine protease n=1 Tax=Baekduia sp. TaxID=2600305 RepID=UPI002D79C49D|nr:rhomboid family intramembrane serine protease [Baekduia sp.]HET6509836.1 rhomboid family intramembrane serine protease [Baekduia sp.]
MFPLKDNIPTTTFPVVTITLILANVLSYFLWQKGGILHGPSNANVIDYGWIPWEVKHLGQQCMAVQGGAAIACGKDVHGQAPVWVTAFTSMFMHGSVIHLAGNMLFLWIFGNNVEDAMGRAKFIVFYLLGGLAALAGQTLIAGGTGDVVPLVGASGAIAAVLGGYILLYPRARVLTVIFVIFFFTLVELPAMAVLGIWFLEQIAFGAAGLTDPAGDSGGVAYFAHIGGFAFGLLAIRAFAHRQNPAYNNGRPRGAVV